MPNIDEENAWKEVSLEDLKLLLRTFSKERDWDKFHTPKNLALALVGEVGELAEIFQWEEAREAGLPEFSAEKRNHLGEELSDVLLYLIRLSDRCGIDLGTAVLKKMEKNRQKYPAELVKGKSSKYTSYTNNSTK